VDNKERKKVLRILFKEKRERESSRVGGVCGKKDGRRKKRFACRGSGRRCGNLDLLTRGEGGRLERSQDPRDHGVSG